MDDLNIKSPLIRDGKRHTNRIKFRVRKDYLQIWLDNKPAAYAGIRFDATQLDEIDRIIKFMTEARELLTQKGEM